MSEQTRLYLLHALTPLHVGIGEGIGCVDLPIMREKVTNWPVVPGSSVKGVLADKHGATDKMRENDWAIRCAFGRAGDDSANAGALVLTDARMLCLPVRSLFGTFAWATSPLVLSRWRRELQDAGCSNLPDEFDMPDGSVRVCSNPLVNGGKVYFEDLTFDVDQIRADSWVDFIAPRLFPVENDSWRTHFRNRFAIVPNDSFDYLCDTATEVNARIKIDAESKTVAGGQFWYEESLPAESILTGLVWCDRVFNRDGTQPTDRHSGESDESYLVRKFCQGSSILQLGGKATIGKGRTRCVFTEGV